MVVSRCAARLVIAAALMVAACGGTGRPAVAPAAPSSAPSGSTPDAVAMSSTAPPPVAVGTTQTSPAGAATITGRVVTQEDASTGIARARVVLTGETIAEPRVAISTENGSFTFEALPAGAYLVTASASGFASQAYAETRTGTAPRVTLTDGQKLTGLQIELARAGVIAGQILDEDNRPFVGATVEALVPRTQESRVDLLGVASATSDDRGEFRLTGLPAGEYFVSASDPAFSKVGDHTGPLRYVPTFYPGVVFLGEARRITVTPGAEPKKILIKLKIVRPSNVKGLLSTPDDRLLISGMVIMSPVEGEALASIPADDAELMPDGTFTFRNVPPGLYQIRARAEVDLRDVALFATYRIRVEGRDVSNIAMTLRPGASISGNVVYDARKTPKPLTSAGIRVRAPLDDGSNFGDALTGDVASDGSFRVRGLMAGTHHVTLEGLNQPWILKQIVWRGKDITDIPVQVEAREVIESVQITVTDVANEITGIVRDVRGRAVADALVIAIPAAPQFWNRTSRRFGLAVSDATGRYRLRGLPAGEYRVAASVEFDESDVYRRDLLVRLSAGGQPLSLGEHDTHAVDLALTSVFSPATR